MMFNILFTIYSLQIEPYFLILALFDAKENRKLTEDVHFDVNTEDAKAMLSQGSSPEENGTKENGVESFYPPEWSNIPHGYLDNLRQVKSTQNLEIFIYEVVFQAILSVTNPHPDVYLVLRVEKVLQGAISQTAEPYIKPGRDSKIAQKVHKAAKVCCQKYVLFILIGHCYKIFSRLGKYRMPFAWSARPLFRHTSGQLDVSAQFSPLFRQEPNKLSDEELLKMLQDFRKCVKIFDRLTYAQAKI
jgi:dedicator of cytokinesis protein 9/10/11